MLKKDLSDIKKHLKLESTMLQFGEIYSIYLKKDSLDIIHKDVNQFNVLDEDTQELYIKNFKKILSGLADTKLFELEFSNNLEDSDNTQMILVDAVNNSDKDEVLEKLDYIVKKIIDNYNYDTDVIITFLKAQYWKGAKVRKAEADEAADDEIYSFQFFLGSINKIEPQKKTLQFDYINRTFKASSILDASINVNAPLDGFMFPCFNNNSSDVNHIMYYSGKNNEVNLGFVERVLNSYIKVTAEEEKNCFNYLIKEVVGDSIKPEIMQSIYEKIAIKAEDIEEDEEAVLSVNDIQVVLEDSGVEVKEIEKLEKICEETLGNTKFDFKVDNILPDFKKKSVKIESEVANISISPQALSRIKQVRDEHGNKCLLIQLDEDIQINGMELEIESFQEI